MVVRGPQPQQVAGKIPALRLEFSAGTAIETAPPSRRPPCFERSQPAPTRLQGELKDDPAHL